MSELANPLAALGDRLPVLGTQGLTQFWTYVLLASLLNARVEISVQYCKAIIFL